MYYILYNHTTGTYWVGWQLEFMAEKLPDAAFFDDLDEIKDVAHLWHTLTGKPQTLEIFPVKIVHYKQPLAVIHKP